MAGPEGGYYSFVEIVEFAVVHAGIRTATELAGRQDSCTVSLNDIAQGAPTVIRVVCVA